jgi:hypothetical protein
MKMKCPQCDFEQADQNTECLRCGIIFGKNKLGFKRLKILSMAQRIILSTPQYKGWGFVLPKGLKIFTLVTYPLIIH